MVTLESIVESIKLQLRPHLNDDIKLYDEFIIRMVNDTRAAMIKALYVSNDALTQFYQQIDVKASAYFDSSGDEDVYLYSDIELPTSLMNGCGRKNIQNISKENLTFSNLTMHYCSYEEFMAYEHHIYGKNNFIVCDQGNKLLVKHQSLNSQEEVDLILRGIFEYPEMVADYDYKTSLYPIGANNLRQLEIVTFQHIASKFGMPVDVINNGYDETKNANVPKQKQSKEQEEE